MDFSILSIYYHNDQCCLPPLQRPQIAHQKHRVDQIQAVGRSHHPQRTLNSQIQAGRKAAHGQTDQIASDQSPLHRNAGPLDPLRAHPRNKFDPKQKSNPKKDRVSDVLALLR